MGPDRDRAAGADEEVVEVAAIQPAPPEAVTDVDAVLSGVHAGLAPEQVEINEQLQSLIVDPINALPEAARFVCGKVRSGEEIARAIPDVEAFLEAMTHRVQGKFFELTEVDEEGQLVMADGCPEAYGLGEDFPAASIRQTRVYYRGENDQTLVMGGRDCYTVVEVDGRKYGVRGTVRVPRLSEAARAIDQKSIIMQSGLPTLAWDAREGKPVGEYARMNAGQFENTTQTWTDDDSLDGSQARLAYRYFHNGHNVGSSVANSRSHADDIGSRGVLRVRLNLES